MKRAFVIFGLLVACSLVANAQKAVSNATGAANNQTTATLSPADKTINLEAGTSLSGQLQNTLDVRHAKVGDQVILTTTQAIKSGGRTVIGKGSRLVGHLTEVAQKGKDNSESRIGILFDRLEQGALQAPIAVIITSVASGRARVDNNNEDLAGSEAMASGSLRSTSSSRSSSSSNGGLPGGVGGVVNSTSSTVGTVVGGTTSAVGSIAESTTSAVGSTTNGVGRSLGGIQISQSSTTSVEVSSVLSLRGGDLRLEKGTNFSLVLTQSVNAGSTKDQ